VKALDKVVVVLNEMVVVALDKVEVIALGEVEVGLILLIHWWFSMSRGSYQ